MSIEVSVIIPAYNTERYIAKAISSALALTLKNIEVIVVDDCSTDNTAKIVKSFTDSRLKLLSNAENMGAGGARNKAIQAAQGKWIAVLDSDDWYALQRLEMLVDLAEQKNADFIADDSYLIEEGANVPWSTIIGQSGEKIKTTRQIEAAEFILSDIEGKTGLQLGFTKPLFRRDFLVTHQIKYSDIKVTQDFWFDMQCFLHGARFFLVPEAYYFYLARPGSLVSSDKIKRLEEESQAISDFLQHKEFLSQNPQVLEALKIKMRETNKWLDYYLVIEPLKQKQISVCLKAVYSKPVVLKYLACQNPIIINRRLKSLFENRPMGNYQKEIFKT
ncbi:MAG: glycosyltransferase family 2 protein [Pleurocapsa sp.]